MVQNGDEPNPSLSSLQFLMRLQGGQFLHDLSSALKDVSNGVMATGKDGDIVVAIKTTAVKGAPNAVSFKTKLTTKVPKPTNQTDLLFVSEDGSLHENNPKQYQLQYGPRPVNVDRSTGEILGSQPRAS